MKRSRWLSVAILFIIVSSLLPLAFSSAALADSGKLNLQDLTSGADSVLVGTVTERNSYWNDAHTNIYTSVVMSVDDKLKGTINQDKVTITVEGGEVEGIGEFVSEMPSFDQGEQAMVFLKKRNNAQLPQAMSLPDKSPAQQFEVYQGFRGKFPIKGDRVNNLPVAQFKGRINSILSGQALPAAELDISPSLTTMPYLYAGYRWPSNKIPVGYQINAPSTYVTAVQNAASMWSSAGANFSFSYAGATAALSPGYDGVNEIMWANLGNVSTLAVTYIWYSGSTLLENDTEFNSYYGWSTAQTCPPGYYDVQSVGLHELGHWLCLSDLYNAADAAKVMYGYSSSGTTKRALTADDIAGIQSIYGASLTVTNSTGASNITASSARLNGELTSTGGENPTVHICWGHNDGGTNPASWDNDINLGTKGIGTFYTDISSLIDGNTYYYRCYATNSAGTSWATSTSSFIAENLSKLIGADDAIPTGGASPSYLFLEKWTATSSGNVNIMRIKATAPGNVKAAIYDDNSGEPGTLLAQQATSTPVNPGWNTITLSSNASVTAGTSYWLAYVADSSCVGYVASTAVGRYKPITFSTFTFTSNPTGLTAETTWYNLLAGWGTIAVTTPTITNAYGASNITSTSARLNGEVTSTGNENPAVTIYYGTTDGGMTPGSWASHVDLGTKGLGTFYTDISSLSNGTTYYYRCYATNSVGTGWAPSTSSFIAQTLNKLVGADDALGSAATAGYLFLEKWTASASGNLTTIRIKGTGTGNVKVAIYADGSGEPGTLLAQQATSTLISAGWNDITLSSTTSVTASTSYWLAYVADSSCVGYVASTAVGRYKPITFSTFTFTSNPTGLTTEASWYNLLAGWGTVIPTGPPNPPDLLSPGAAITFKWGAPSGATKYQVQVSTSSSFTTTVFDADVGNNTSQEVTGLSLGTLYYWHVRAGNDGGWGNWSTTRSVTVNQVP